MKLILNDGTEHEVRSGTLPGTFPAYPMNRH